MFRNKRYIISTAIMIAIVIFMTYYKLPYYVYQPGDASALDPVVEVEGGYESEGNMHLVTVRGGPATPAYYLWAKIRPHYDIYPIDQVRPEGISHEEYFQTQLHLMESSQEAATVVAYEAANKSIEIEYKGVFILSVMDDMPAKDVLQIGDQIISVDGMKVEQTSELIDYVEGKEEGETVDLTIVRDGVELTKTVSLASFPHMPDKIGMGITLVTDREVEVDPPVNFHSGNIGGPSAGLMFSLEIYDQLTEGDLTKGYHVAGTGEITYEGEVLRIGGIDKKVVAAHRKGMDIFFAPNENGREGSNYEEALKAAEEINTEMKIVPVDSFSDALHYLEGLVPKSS